MSALDDDISSAEKLEPAERLQLIKRLWRSIPAAYWPQQSDVQMDDVSRQMAKLGVERSESVPWPIVEQLTSTRSSARAVDMIPSERKETVAAEPPDDWLQKSDGESAAREHRVDETGANIIGPLESPDETPIPPAVERFDNAAQLAESLAPFDRVRLIARLWHSLPQEMWPPLSDRELTAARRRLMESDARWYESVPWPVVERLLADRFAPRVYSAPRRFDLVTLFIVTLAYSLLFALMSSFQFPPGASLTAAGFITIVGVAQAVLFGGRRPRAASIWTGAVLYCVPVLGGLIGLGPLAFAGVPSIYLGMQLVIGGLFGYLAGACVGGVFLLADVVRRKYRRGDELADIASAGPFDQSTIDLYVKPIESPPDNALWQFLFDPHGASKLFSAPRRFDLATIFVITAAFSLLFGFLSVVDRASELVLQPGLTIVAGGLLTAVAIGQAWSFGQANPRGVSVVVGAITFAFFTIILSWIYPRMFAAPWLLVVLFSGVIGGAFLGYIAGVLVGGMFLIADVLRRKFSSTLTDEDEDPFAEVDQPPADRKIDAEPAVSATEYH
jgi:hypothetical protein